MKLTIQFTQDRETKNTIRFQEVSDPPAIGTLYVQKHALKQLSTEGYPQHITVTVEVSHA